MILMKECSHISQDGVVWVDGLYSGNTHVLT